MDISCGTILVYQNKILICRPRWDRPTWNLPKGGMEEGETYASAAFRETLEESNIDVSICGKRIKDIGMTPYLNNKDLYLFLVELDSIPDIKCNSFYEENNKMYPEMVDYKWIDFHEYDKYFGLGLKKVFKSLENEIIEFINEE